VTSPPAHQHYGITLAALALAGLAFALLQSLVAPALPEIQQSLHASESDVTWVLTAYLLSASVATPLLGRLGDIHGKERVLVGVLVALAVGTVISALATSLPLLVAGRVVQGAGGGVFPLAFGIIRDEFPRDRVAGAIGFISAILGIGAGAGIVLAGVIVDHLSSHWLFWFPLVVVVIAAVATVFYVPESPVKAPARISWGAAALLSAGLTAVLLAVSHAATWGWGSARTLGLVAAGLVVLVF
jgi:MFS family permease